MRKSESTSRARDMIACKYLALPKNLPFWPSAHVAILVRRPTGPLQVASKNVRVASFPFGLDRVLDRCSRRESRVRKRREDHPGPPHDRLERHKARKPGQRQNASNEEQGEAHGRIQLGAPDDEEEDPQAETDQPDWARAAIRPIQDLVPPALDFGGQVEHRLSAIPAPDSSIPTSTVFVFHSPQRPPQTCKRYSHRGSSWRRN